MPSSTALGGAGHEALLGLASDGRPSTPRGCTDSAVEQRADASDGFLDRRELVIPGREDLELVDLRSIAMQGRRRAGGDCFARRGQGGARLARATWVLRELRSTDTVHGRRLAARMRRLQDASFSAHRPRRDHAGDRRRSLPAWPAAALSQGHVFGAGRFRRARRDDRGGGQARNPRGIGSGDRPRALRRLATLAISIFADDRLFCARAYVSGAHRRAGARGRALVHARGSA